MKHKALLMTKESNNLVETDLSLKSMYNLLDTDIIEIPTIIPALREQGILTVIDEEGKLKDENFINFLIVNEEGAILDEIMGNVLFVRDAPEGEMTGLKNGDIELILSVFTKTVIATLYTGETLILKATVL